jgi:hypothetical protein
MLVVVESTIRTVSLELVEATRRRYLIRLSGSGLLTDSVPNTVDDLFVGETFKDAITSYQKEVKVVFQFKCSDFRLTNYNVCIAPISWPFSLNVAKSSGNR